MRSTQQTTVLVIVEIRVIIKFNLLFLQAIRSEYLKLKGVLFAWVEGVHPHPKTRMILK